MIAFPPESLSDGDANAKVAVKEEDKKHSLQWSRETGNLQAPASGSEIKAVIERSQTCRGGLTSCTCEGLAAGTFPVSDARKPSL